MASCSVMCARGWGAVHHSIWRDLDVGWCRVLCLGALGHMEQSLYLVLVLVQCGFLFSTLVRLSPG